MMNKKIEARPGIVLDFIRQFQQFGPQVTDCFSNGMCWYFTTILRARFGWEYLVMYDPIVNHFATQIDDRIYDITGDITDNPEYKFEMWATFIYKDPKHTNRIRRDCILKVPPQVQICNICGHGYYDDYGNYICDKDNSPVEFDVPCQKGETRE